MLCPISELLQNGSTKSAPGKSGRLFGSPASSRKPFTENLEPSTSPTESPKKPRLNLKEYKQTPIRP
jgi:hypothetical protein